MRHSYPIMLDVTERLVVIVGGGTIAARKASGLLETGATRIRCVSPAFEPAMSERVDRIEAPYEPSHLDGAGLVFAATDLPAVNDAVVRDARARGVLVSRADALEEEVERGDFITPARFNEAGVIVSVAAGSAALAVLIRNGLAGRWDKGWSRMAEAMRILRPILLKQRDLDPKRRRKIFRELASPEAINILTGKGLDGLQVWLAGRLRELERDVETEHA